MHRTSSQCRYIKDNFRKILIWTSQNHPPTSLSLRPSPRGAGLRESDLFTAKSGYLSPADWLASPKSPNPRMLDLSEQATSPLGCPLAARSPVPAGGNSALTCGRSAIAPYPARARCFQPMNAAQHSHLPEESDESLHPNGGGSNGKKCLKPKVTQCTPNFTSL